MRLLSTMTRVQLDTGVEIGDAELTELLTQAFVGGGFTTAEIGAQMFESRLVRARGELLYVRDAGARLAGVVCLVAPSSPARRFALAGEVEMHLLAVRDDARGAGLGRALVMAAIGRAREQHYERLLLWTQATMFAAHALYAATGFERRPERDFTRDGRDFLFLALAL